MVALSPQSWLFLFAALLMLLILPRRWAPLPLLIGVCYLPSDQGLAIGSLHFYVIRILIGVGIIRVFLKSERIAGGLNPLDKLIIYWGIWILCSLFLIEDMQASLNSQLGRVYNTWGIYFLLRTFCQSKEDLVGLVEITAIILLPLAFLMLCEKLLGQNLFSFFGGTIKIPMFRSGAFRAQGPFAHSILAGTVGAVCLPLIVGIWWKNKKVSLGGIIACLVMIYSSGSSGPILSALSGCVALYLWHFRASIHLTKWFALIGYIFLDVIMKAPAYYVLARIDLGIGSTGYHRALLIETAIVHFHEWWLAGTDYTRHWMPTGVSWSPDHVDITNHYIYLGVVAGIMLVILFLLSLAKGFSFIGQLLKSGHFKNFGDQFFIWAIGASLFSHASTMISVAYFDQSFIFLYLNLAAIGSMWSVTMKSPEKELEPMEYQRVSVERRWG